MATSGSLASPPPRPFDAYIYSQPSLAGTVGANNFLSLMNPVGNSFLVSVGALFVSSVALNSTTSVEPLRGHRITSHSGGTDVPTTDIVKLDTLDPNPTVQIKIGNPTVGGMGPGFFNSPPVITTGTGGTSVHDIDLPAGAPPFLLRPGEGLVVRAASGDVDQRWNMSIVWGEFS